MENSVSKNRSHLCRTLFPRGIPSLWCPPITHFNETGLDQSRIESHLAHMIPHVPAFLIPGSTGEGWEMNDKEIRVLIDFMLSLAGKYRATFMIGVLKTQPHEAFETIQKWVSYLFPSQKTVSPEDFQKKNLSGFVVTAPKGKNLSSREIQRELEAVCSLNHPLALYQLPQVTENEIAPETVRDLAQNFPNFYLLKDTSGKDHVIHSRLDYQNVFFVRGAEGGYNSSLKSAGGLYDGLLLSSANNFAHELRTIISLSSRGLLDDAKQISESVSRVIHETFALVSKLPFANPFSNANKSLDHLFAHGKKYMDHPLPLTRSGNRIPLEVLDQTANILLKNGFHLSKGYFRTSEQKEVVCQTS